MIEAVWLLGPLKRVNYPMKRVNYPMNSATFAKRFRFLTNRVASRQWDCAIVWVKRPPLSRFEYDAFRWYTKSSSNKGAPEVLRKCAFPLLRMVCVERQVSNTRGCKSTNDRTSEACNVRLHPEHAACVGRQVSKTRGRTRMVVAFPSTAMYDIGVPFVCVSSTDWRGYSTEELPAILGTILFSLFFVIYLQQLV